MSPNGAEAGAVVATGDTIAGCDTAGGAEASAAYTALTAKQPQKAKLANTNGVALARGWAAVGKFWLITIC